MYWNLHFILLALCVAHSQIMNINTPYVNSSHVLYIERTLRVSYIYGTLMGVWMCVRPRNQLIISISLYSLIIPRAYEFGAYLFLSSIHLLLLLLLSFCVCCFVLFIFHASRIILYGSFFVYTHSNSHMCVWRSEFFFQEKSSRHALKTLDIGDLFTLKSNARTMLE